MRIAYFVHDLSDAGVAKRVRMLRAAGADVVVVGFRREGRTVSAIDGAPAIGLDATYDARLVGRAFNVLRRCSRLGPAVRSVETADVFLARNLEMLAIAAATITKHARHAVLVYECLDIHRLLFSESLIGRFLRLIERLLLNKCKLLILSSPAFVSGYFEPKQGFGRESRPPLLIVENKLFEQGRHPPRGTFRKLERGPPWRIGWFGTVRCRRSLEILSELARRNRGLVEVVIAGRPPQVEFGADFAAVVEHCPGVTYRGPYNAAEIGELYDNVHFAWAIDYFEEGANSALLLPNRIYEGGAYGAVPIALGDTETGRWLDQRGLGLRLSSPAEELPQFFRQLRPAAYDAMKHAIQSAPRELFVADEKDCERLMRALTTAASHQRGYRRYAGISPSR